MPSTADWFSNTQLPTAPPRRRLPRFVPVAIAVVVLASLGSLGAWAYTTFSQPACLAANDYQQLTGQDYSDDSLNATTNFYTAILDFQDGQPASDSQTELKKVAQFYSSHSGKSIHFTVDSTYTDNAYLALTTKSTTAAKQALVTGGVPAEAITISEPQFITPEEPTGYDDETANQSTVTLSITSVEPCR